MVTDGACSTGSECQFTAKKNAIAAQRHNLDDNSQTSNSYNNNILSHNNILHTSIIYACIAGYCNIRE